MSSPINDQVIELEDIQKSTISSSNNNKVRPLTRSQLEKEVPIFFNEIKEKKRRKLINKIKDKFKKKKKDKKSHKKSEIDSIVSSLGNDHSITLQEISTKYTSHINFNDPKASFGLTGEDAINRLKENGRNSLTPGKTTPKWLKFVKQFTGLFPLMLEVGGILAFIAYGVDTKGKDNLYLGIILWIVVSITAIFSFLQESKSDKVMEGFKKMAPGNAKVIRDSRLIEINSEELVVGDVVHVKAGDKVPADIRILYSGHMKVDNSSLTGESEAQSRTSECTDPNPLETKNLAFYSTLVVSGDGIGIVISCGDNTIIGKIAKLASKTKPKDPPLKKEIEKFIKLITCVALAMGVIFIAVGFGTKVVWINVVIFVIGLVVAEVPEGLLPTITVALTSTATRMSQRNVLVKSLLSIETFGSTRTIASDKTGTLTQNIMTVVNLWYDTKKFEVTNESIFTNSPTFNYLYSVATLCNRAVFDDSNQDIPSIQIQNRKTIGDASESALIKFCESIKPITEYRNSYGKIFEIPFNSTNKWQLSIHREMNNSDNIFLVMKGAPERIIKRCNRIMIEGEEKELTSDHINEFERVYEEFASRGERILGHAYLKLDPNQYDTNYPFDMERNNYPSEDLVFIGLTTLMDPPRPSVPDSIKSCKEAGIRVMMVTGDHPLTAASIAKQIGIIRGETLNEVAKRDGIQPEDIYDMDFSKAPAIVVPGSHLDSLTEIQWRRILSLQEIVFARTSPEQKLIIVEHCQKMGDIVVVTGDGVNDSPALKQANLGCAMGISGSEVAKEAASVVLLDDNFSSIVAGVEEGRMLFDRLKKAICYTLSSNIPELVPFIFFFLFQFPVALSGILILCIDLGTDLLPVISFAYEPPEMDLMKRKPRDLKKDRLVTLKLALFSYGWLGVIQCIAGFVNFFLLFNDYGLSISDIFWTSSKYFMIEDAPDYMGYNYSQQKEIITKAQTSYFVAVAITRIGALLSCKTRKLSIFYSFSIWRNKIYNIGVAFILGITLIIVHVPGIRTFFGTEIISFKYWLIPLPFVAFILITNEIRLYFIRNYPNSLIGKYAYW